MRHNNVLVTERIHDRGMDLIEKSAVLLFPDNLSQAGLTESMSGIDGLIIRTSRVTESVIAAGENLKVIGVHGIGVDYVDVGAATKRGIPVVNVPHANTISVAEHAVSCMLNLTKGLRKAEAALRSGLFDRAVPLGVSVTELGYTSSDIYGKTVGLIGFGNTARKLASVCSLGFSMNVIAYDPHVSPDVMRDMNVTPMSDQDSLLKISDYVSVHVPLIPETMN
ncbi:MAG: phosphoglycerate dehydrogenase, partial [Gammaproteobacteria bacterium]|nr:phosphoglycerate dehydrogenase [Gammaproteobacteria bacterium]